ncbi:unnamed protein product [Durusdinium trenchii]|uniref:AB hydrolase-1 domain-containing protein n=1 Tax=Durusdinium trenchii TaxID=1381693 RepID=A0ABP0RZD1_9DINO
MSCVSNHDLFNCPGSPPHNLDACALDVLDTLKEAGVRRDAELIVCGHSFGGKVALAVLEALQAQGTPPRKTWIFDSVPGCPAALPAEEERREQSVGFVFKVVQSTSGQQFAERADLVRHLQSHGLSQPLAEWIAQSVRSTPEGFELSYDIDVVGQLYAAYQGKDMWHLFKGPAVAASAGMPMKTLTPADLAEDVGAESFQVQLRTLES